MKVLWRALVAGRVGGRGFGDGTREELPSGTAVG